MPQQTLINPPQKPKTVVLTDATGVNAITTDGLGNLNVNLAAGSISGGNAAAAPTGAPPPVSADYTGFKDGSGNLVGVSAATPLPVSASVTPAPDPAEAAVGAAVPAEAIQIGGSDGTLLRAVATDAAGQVKVLVENAPAVAVNNFPATQPVSGSVAVSNFPAVQAGNKVAVTSVVNAGNSSTTPLAGNGVFTGATIDLVASQLTAIQVQVLADQVGVLHVQFSTDSVNFDHDIQSNVTANASTSLATGIHGRYVRVVYTNGGTPQTFMRLQTILTPESVQATVKDIDTLLVGDENAVITHSIVTGKTTAGGGAFVDVKVNPSGALAVDGSGVTQPVSGSVSVSNLPATQPVSGTVAVSNFPATQPVSAVALPLPSGAATDASVTNTQVAAGATVAPTKVLVVAGKSSDATPQYQPVPLTAAGAAVKVDGSAATQPVSGTVGVNNFPATQPVSAASLPLPAGAATAAKQPALGTAGTPSADVLSVQGVASMTALKVDGSAVTQPVSGTVTAAQATPASLQATVTPIAITKGTQGATGFTTQDLKDAGRVQVTLFAFGLTGTTTEALTTMSITKGVVAQTAATSYTVTAGKTLRIGSIRATMAIPSTTGVSSIIHVRSAAASIAANSPVIAQLHIGSPGATAFSTGTDDSAFPDGLEIAGGTQIAITHLESSAVAGSATTGAGLSFCLVGYEY